MTSRGNMLNFLDSARAYMDTALQRPGTAPCRSVNLRRFLQRNILKRPAPVRPAQPGPIRQCRRRKSTATTTTSALASPTTSSATVYTSSAKASVFTSSTKASQSAAKASSSAAACVKSGNKGLPLPHSQPFPVLPASQASSPQCPVMLRINDDCGNHRLQPQFSEIQHSVRGNPPLVIDTRNTSSSQACGVGSRYSEHYSNPSCAFSSHGGFHQSVQTGLRLSECGQTPHPGHSIDNGCGELLLHPDASSAGYFDLPVTNSDLCATEVTSTLPLPFHSHSGQETFGYRPDAFVPVYNRSSWEDQRNPFANVTGPGFPSPTVAVVNCGYDDRNDSVFSSNAQQHNGYYENSSGVHRKTLPVVGNAEDLYQYSSREPNLGTMRSNPRVHDGTHLNVIETDVDEALALPFCVTGHSYLEHVFSPGSMLNRSVPNSLNCSFSSIPDIDPSLFEGQDIMDIGDNQDLLEMGSSLMDVSASTSHDLHTAEGCVLSDLSNGPGGNAASTVTSMPRSTLVVSHIGKVLSTAVVKPSLETPKNCLERSFAHNETDRTDLAGRVSHFRHNTWPPSVETLSCAEAAVTSTHLHDSRGRQTVFDGSSELLSLQSFGPEPQHEYCVSNSWDTSVSTAVPDCNSFIQSTSCYQPLLQYITQNDGPPLLASLSSFEDKDAASKLPLPSVASDLVVRYSADNQDSDEFELFDEEDCLDKLLEALEQVEGAAPVDSSEEDAHVEFDPNNEEDIEPLMNLLRDRQENVVSAACQDISENTASQRTLLNEIHVGDSLLNTLLCPRSALPAPGRAVEDTQCLRYTNQLGCVIPAEDFMTSAASEEMFDENSAPVFSACSVPVWKFGPQGHQSTVSSHQLPSAVSHVSKSVASSSCGTQPVKSQRSLSLVIPPTSLPLPLGSMSQVTAFPSSGLPDTPTSTSTAVLSKEPHVSSSSPLQAQVPAPQSLRIISTVMQAQGIQEKQPAAETPKLLVLSSPNSSQQSSPVSRNDGTKSRQTTAVTAQRVSTSLPRGSLPLVLLPFSSSHSRLLLSKTKTQSRVVSLPVRFLASNNGESKHSLEQSNASHPHCDQVPHSGCSSAESNRTFTVYRTLAETSPAKQSSNRATLNSADVVSDDATSSVLQENVQQSVTSALYNDHSATNGLEPREPPQRTSDVVLTLAGLPSEMDVLGESDLISNDDSSSMWGNDLEINAFPLYESLLDRTDASCNTVTTQPSGENNIDDDATSAFCLSRDPSELSGELLNLDLSTTPETSLAVSVPETYVSLSSVSPHRALPDVSDCNITSKASLFQSFMLDETDMESNSLKPLTTENTHVQQNGGSLINITTQSNGLLRINDKILTESVTVDVTKPLTRVAHFDEMKDDEAEEFEKNEKKDGCYKITNDARFTQNNATHYPNEKSAFALQKNGAKLTERNRSFIDSPVQTHHHHECYEENGYEYFESVVTDDELNNFEEINGIKSEKLNNSAFCAAEIGEALCSTLETRVDSSGPVSSTRRTQEEGDIQSKTDYRLQDGTHVELLTTSGSLKLPPFHVVFLSDTKRTNSVKPKPN